MMMRQSFNHSGLDSGPARGGKAADCRKCRHYFVTWDKTFPHGCRAIGFKSRQLPNIAVRKNSGKDCLLFKQKENNAMNCKTLTLA